MNTSKLEIFPNEIFFEIFDYLSIQELYKSFYNLNNYLTTILMSYTNIPTTITSNQNVNFFAINFFSPRITRLSINYHYSIDLSSFQSLRSIKILDKPNCFQKYSLKNLLNLELICIVHNTQWNSDCLIQLSDDIMTNSFPHLRLCQIGQVIDNQQYHWKILPLLRSLTICTKDVNIYSKILYFCPYLNRLKLILDVLTKSLSFEYSSHLFLHKFEICLALRSISICELLSFLLSPLSNLTHLIIHGPNQYPKQLNINLLGPILHKHVPKLIQFNFQMAIDNTLALQLIQNNYIDISRIHPLFIHIKVNQRHRQTPAKIIISS
ncbi:unnamed protein product [Adineta steineri]|uniref:F-box domain-containing protein n=1 Tax=Adineta steineri TaxID=433720 RepID=A0A819IU79_9BILA|nr:unnamed protein product [Adineta steineri]CAF3917278.1 unnamed protein product [Adineta steineri]